MKNPELNTNDNEQPIGNKPGDFMDERKGAESDIYRLEQLQKKIDTHRFMTVTEGEGKLKEEVMYPDSRKGRTELEEIRLLKERYKDNPLFEEYETRTSELLKAKREKINAGILARNLKREMELEQMKEEAKNHIPKEINESKKAVMLKLSPEEMKQGEEQLQLAIKRQTKDGDQKIRWWQFWKY